MTIVLDYALDPSWRRHWEGLDLRSADETALHYKCFLGDVVFIVDDADFSARWGWVPVLDFALSLRAIATALGASDYETFEFTESDDVIEFTRRDGGIRLEASYVKASAEVSYAELSLEAERFLARLLAEFGQTHPELRENAFIQTLSRKLTPSP